MTLPDYILITLAAIAAGAINALAGGGTLLSFPALLAGGVPAVAANVTNTVALLPGYIGGTLAQARDLKGQMPRLLLFLPAGFLGGLFGGWLLLQTGEELFQELIPFLILLACALLAIQDPVRGWLTRRAAARGRSHTASASTRAAGTLAVGLASIYGGYFGAGLSVIILSALGLTQDDSLTRLNAIKQIISFSANLAAALFFVFSGRVIWTAALVMAAGALLGGVLGGRLAGRMPPAVLRWTVVTLGVVIAIIYLVR